MSLSENIQFVQKPPEIDYFRVTLCSAYWFYFRYETHNSTPGLDVQNSRGVSLLHRFPCPVRE